MATLGKTLLSRETSLSIKMAERSGFSLDVPAFGRSRSTLSIRATGGADAGRITAEVSNRLGSIQVVFSARTGQRPFPQGSYTVRISAKPRGSGNAETVTLLGTPDLTVSDAARHKLDRIARLVGSFRMRNELLEIAKEGPAMLLRPLELAHIQAQWFVGSSILFNDKPSKWKVIWKCGLQALLCVLSSLAATSGVGIAAALVACALLGTNCGELIGEYIDP